MFGRDSRLTFNRKHYVARSNNRFTGRPYDLQLIHIYNISTKMCFWYLDMKPPVKCLLVQIQFYTQAFWNLQTSSFQMILGVQCCRGGATKPKYSGPGSQTLYFNQFAHITTKHCDMNRFVNAL